MARKVLVTQACDFVESTFDRIVEKTLCTRVVRRALIHYPALEEDSQEEDKEGAI